MNRALRTQTYYDAIIVGARVAGAATALLLARSGLRVLLIDRGSYGADTLSTHALMRGGVLQLHRWGLLPRVKGANTPPIRSTTFHYGDESVRVQIKPRDGMDAFYAPRRHVLDRLLVDAAREAGAEVRFGRTAIAVTRAPSGRVNGVVFLDASRQRTQTRAGIVIGADGLRSAVASMVQAATVRQGIHATAVMYGYWPGLAVDGSQWYWAPGLAAGAIPTNDNETCVFAAVPSHAFGSVFRPDVRTGYLSVIDRCAPEIAARLRASTHAPQLRGFPGSPGWMRHSWGPGWALVGDAGYYKDPITAHGITDALRDAELLASAVRDGSLPALVRYQRNRDELAAGVFAVTDAVASFTWDFPTLRRLHQQLSDEMKREALAITSWSMETATTDSCDERAEQDTALPVAP